MQLFNCPEKYVTAQIDIVAIKVAAIKTIHTFSLEIHMI